MLRAFGCKSFPFRSYSTNISFIRKHNTTSFTLKEKLQVEVEKLIANTQLDYLFIKQQQEQMETKHKEVLDNFWKKSLTFNPLYKSTVNIDIRFMPKQVEDEVYEEFENQAIEPTAQLYSLRAISGAGKTGTILNAIGRNAFLLYVQCDIFTFDRQDYFDHPSARFISDLTLRIRRMNASKDDKSLCALNLCSGFWLCRLMLLEAMKVKFPEMTPEQWIFWSNAGGQSILRPFQNKTYREILNIMNHEPDKSEELLEYLNDLLENYQEKMPNVWYAVDEAQNIQPLLKDHLLSKNKTGPSNLLHVLAVHSLPSSALKVVAGTRMAHFEGLVSTSGGKGTDVYQLSDRPYCYPYVSPDIAMEKLGEWVNLDGITKENLDQAHWQLQGRLRYVFAFLRFLYQTAHERRKARKTKSPMSMEEKNSIFVQALIMLKNDIFKTMEYRYNRIIAATSLPREQIPGLLTLPTFPEHLLTLLTAHYSDTSLYWDVEEFQQHYGITPEDTGFLFFDKILDEDEYKYYYSVKEPQLVPLVIKLLRSHFPQNALNSLIGSDRPINFGSALEKTFGLFMMAPNFKRFLDNCHSKQNWYQNLIIKWTQFGDSKNLKDLEQVIEEVRNLRNAEKRANSLQNLDFLIRRADGVGLKDLDLLKEIADNATDDKIGELLFMMIQPTNILLQPSREIGPDIIGFCETNSGEKVMVLLSLSFRPGSNSTQLKEQFEKNKYKQEPTNFYSKIPQGYSTSRSAEIRNHQEFYETKTIMNKIALPSKLLMLCASMPETLNRPIEEGVDSRPEAVRIYINQANLANLSVALDKLLLKKFSVFKATRKATFRDRFV
eukprot:TRINITY_DN5209_c0_g2_i7.p1 TRINITY_DN5209_c0_g2~~TRINITY_DN5209_c0_g2_i7.p1  ORF type:complete len:832 (+),score=105.53 TRINITY_DN5209_c0_g2_i7:13-2508(+)